MEEEGLWYFIVRNPGKAISILIMIDNPIPKDPPIIPDNIYNAPIKI